MSQTTDLQIDNVSPIKNAKRDIFRITEPGKVKTAEDADKEIMGFTPDYWLASNMRKKGRTVKDIFDHFGGRYSMAEVGHMLNKVVAVNSVLPHWPLAPTLASHARTLPPPQKLK